MAQLDEFQKKAVYESGNILLIAGAGAGKTFTITQKINYLVEENICKPSEILIISFTNKSVDDLKRKINLGCYIMTFHKLSMMILDDHNISYNLVSDDHLEFICNNYFEVLINEEEKKNILKYFREYDYEKFLKSYNYKELVKLITNVIKIYKTNNCSMDDFKRMYKKNTFLSKYIYIIKCLYEANLREYEMMDFDDLIINATNVLNSPYKFKYIIVDEFQDTSMIRFNLVNKLRKVNNANLFVVGDDYQSIYHFSGCDLNIFLNFTKMVSNAKTLKLKYTYRNSQELISISSMFVMKNKTQISKELLSHKHIDKPIEFIYYINPKKAFNKLYKKLKDINEDVLVLGRNNNDIKEFSDKEDINYMTVHSSKGLEAQNVILINLTDRIYGFPNKIVNSKLIEELHPSDQSYLFAEERRLFYVALTRTKEKVYLLVPIFKASVFVKELKKTCKDFYKSL